MTLNKITRGTIAALSLAAVLGVSACGTSPQSGASSAPEASTSATPDYSKKVPGFAAGFASMSAPEGWAGSDGWTAPLGLDTGAKMAPAVSLGDNIGYFAAETSDGSTKDAIYIADSTGDKVYSSAELPGQKSSSSYYGKISSGGVDYIYLTRLASEAVAADSIKQGKTLPHLLIVDENGKETFSDFLSEGVDVRHKGAVLEIKNSDKVVETIDPATGNATPFTPEVMAGYTNVLTVNGGTIFVQSGDDIAENAAIVTNGDWKIKATTRKSYGSERAIFPYQFGPYLSVPSLDAISGEKGGCAFYDLETGKQLDILKELGGGCVEVKSTSANDRFLIFESAATSGGGLLPGVGGVLDTETGKAVLSKGDYADFRMLSVDNEGKVYGGLTSSGGSVVLDLVSGDEPKKIEAERVPSMIAGNGVGVFGTSNELVFLTPSKK